MPFPRNDNGALSVTFNYLIPANRGSYSMRLQHSTILAPESWTEVEIPDTTSTIDGVECLVTALPGGRLNQIKAIVPAGPAGRAFVRLAASGSSF